ncbi:DUF2066 domain-containing protein [Pseudomonas sp. gcc21]|uniref:DUF2066 domain-containing protein n=1 Tax=Pseudomonas sp. gcc21 TaxID=2726989 RepID=UPI0014514928|nr:DUF2066 domain-containing protein [Pseudomonas sp. gcc21]QJD57516.1 DUF2066 domain-containing protein [Pseudomonas sp. gcc21]
MFSLRTVVVSLLSLVLWTPFNLSAAVLEGLYRVNQPQAEDASRDETLRQAAEVMFTRVGGANVNLDSGPVANALSDPRDLVRRISGRDGSLLVEFEPSAVRRVMVSGGLPMLGRSRPGMLVWAVEARTLGDELIGAGSTWGDRLKTAAAYRGVALSFPMGDLEDRGMVTEEVVRQGNREDLLEASERYSSEGVLAVAFTANGESTRADWHMWLNDRAYSGRVSEDDPAAAADQIMREVAAAAFEQYAVPAVSEEELTRWTLVVQDINSVNDYASLQGMLQQLGGQSTPQMLSVDTDVVTVRIDFPGSESQLERMLSLDQRLVRIPAPEPEPVEQGPILLPEPAPQPTPALGATDQSGETGPTDDPLNADADTLTEPEQAPVNVLPEPVEPDPHTLYYRWR